jgi:CBS domain-containing protein
MTVAAALEQTRAARHSAYPVVDSEGLCVGMIGKAVLHAAGKREGAEVPLSSLMREVPVVAFPEETLLEVSLRLAQAGQTRCPVVASRARPILVGFLSASDLLRARIRGAESSWT